MKISFALLIIFVASIANSQTISPLNAQFGKKARGQFSLTNDGFTAMAVTVEVETMAIQHGQLLPAPLLPTTHVKMSEYSTRIPAHQTHVFYYDATCDALPCAFILWGTMALGHTDQGVGVEGHLGHVAYICAKEKNCRMSVLAATTPANQ